MGRDQTSAFSARREKLTRRHSRPCRRDCVSGAAPLYSSIYIVVIAHDSYNRDSVATRGRAQGQAVIEYLGKRPAMQNQSLVGSVTAASRFEDTRHYLSTRLSSAVKTTLRTDEEAKEKDEVFHFLWNTAVLSVGLQTCALAAAIGTFVELLQPITGMAVASSLAVGGGSCYAVGTTRIAHVYDTKWLRKSKDLGEALVSISDKEFDRVCGRILDGVGPYTRFVGNEKERIANLKEECEGVCAASRNLRNRINKLQ